MSTCEVFGRSINNTSHKNTTFSLGINLSADNIHKRFKFNLMRAKAQTNLPFHSICALKLSKANKQTIFSSLPLVFVYNRKNHFYASVVGSMNFKFKSNQSTFEFIFAVRDEKLYSTNLEIVWNEYLSMWRGGWIVVRDLSGQFLKEDFKDNLYERALKYF